MDLSWRRGPHLQPTPPSVSSVLLAPSPPLSLFKPPPVRDLYDPDALLGVQDLPCSCTLSCLSVMCCRSLSCILCIPARLGQYPVISCLFLCHNVASCWMPPHPPPLHVSSQRPEDLCKAFKSNRLAEAQAQSRSTRRPRPLGGRPSLRFLQSKFFPSLYANFISFKVISFSTEFSFIPPHCRFLTAWGRPSSFYFLL